MNRWDGLLSVLVLMPSAACGFSSETARTDAKASPSPAVSPTSSLSYPYILREQTLFEGEILYTCEPDGCWREGGTIAGPPEYYYPELDRTNEEIARLIADIGLPTAPVMDDREAWERIRRVWAWLREQAVFPGDPGHPETWKYLIGLSRSPWPSIGDMAEAYARFGKLPVDACNSKAFTFVTLLYRVGIGADRVSAATGLISNAGHVYVVLQVEGRWRAVDPSCIRGHPELSQAPESVGCFDNMDYAHPTQLEPLPGSDFPSPMLAE
jgi:hypothetical protein